MRTIKFRIWTGNKFDLCTIEELIYEDGNYYSYNGENLGYVVQQFTGLLDKNGKEIYEGDVVTCCGGYDYPEGVSGDCEDPRVVEFKHGKWIVKCPFDREELDLYEYDLDEIIGNIYENPELLSANSHDA